MGKHSTVLGGQGSTFKTGWKVEGRGGGKEGSEEGKGSGVCERGK